MSFFKLVKSEKLKFNRQDDHTSIKWGCWNWNDVWSHVSLHWLNSVFLRLLVYNFVNETFNVIKEKKMDVLRFLNLILIIWNLGIFYFLSFCYQWRPPKKWLNCTLHNLHKYEKRLFVKLLQHFSVNGLLKSFLQGSYVKRHWVAQFVYLHNSNDVGKLS